GDAILGDDIMHVEAPNADAIAGLERGLDPRGATVCRRGKADDGLAAFGLGSSAHEGMLGREPAIELALELIDADLTGQIHGKGLGDRDHAIVGRHGAGIAHLFDGLEIKERIVMHEIIELPCPEAVAGDDAIPVQRLAPSGYDARFGKAHYAVRDDIAVDAEI